MKKNKNIVIIGVIFILALAGLIWFARPAPSNNNLASVNPGTSADLEKTSAVKKRNTDKISGIIIKADFDSQIFIYSCPFGFF